MFKHGSEFYLFKNMKNLCTQNIHLSPCFAGLTWNIVKGLSFLTKKGYFIIVTFKTLKISSNNINKCKG